MLNCRVVLLDEVICSNLACGLELELEDLTNNVARATRIQVATGEDHQSAWHP